LPLAELSGISSCGEKRGALKLMKMKAHQLNVLPTSADGSTSCAAACVSLPCNGFLNRGDDLSAVTRRQAARAIGLEVFLEPTKSETQSEGTAATAPPRSSLV